MRKKFKEIEISEELDKSISDAPSREELSPPANFLLENGLIVKPGLDYGSGYGYDADHLGLDKYDPFHGPTKYPTSKYKTIVCIDVLNQLKNDSERTKVLGNILGLLDEDGIAYISIPNSSGVKLNLSIFVKGESFILYKLQAHPWEQ